MEVILKKRLLFLLLNAAVAFTMQPKEPLVSAEAIEYGEIDPNTAGYFNSIDSKYSIPTTTVEDLCKGGKRFSIAEGYQQLEALDFLRLKNILIDFTCYFEVIKDQFFSYPLGGIAECSAQGCTASRSINPNVRYNFEKSIVAYLTRQYPDKNQKIIYTSFASGNTLPEIRILTLLSNLGYKDIELNLIDIEYKKTFNLIPTTKTITQEYLYNKYNHLNTGCLTKSGIYILTSYANALRWLISCGLNTTLNVFSSARAYKSYCEKNNVEANIVVAHDHYSCRAEDPDCYKDLLRAISTLAINAYGLTYHGANSTCELSRIDYTCFVRAQKSAHIKIAELEKDFQIYKSTEVFANAMETDSDEECSSPKDTDC